MSVGPALPVQGELGCAAVNPLEPWQTAQSAPAQG